MSYVLKAADREAYMVKRPSKKHLVGVWSEDRAKARRFKTKEKANRALRKFFIVFALYVSE
jgi:hypothetical protein